MIRRFLFAPWPQAMSYRERWAWSRFIGRRR